MSCGNPAVEGTDAVMQRKPKYDKSRICVKCKENLGKIVVRHAVYCKDCFFPFMSFKFRRSLEPFVNAKPDGPRKTALKPTGDILVGFSGGLGSSVLLDLIHRSYVSPNLVQTNPEGGRDHPRKDRVWKNVNICYVEVSDAFTQMKDNTEDIRHSIERYKGLEFTPLRAQDAFDPSWWAKTDREFDLSHMGVDLTSEDLLLSSISQGSSPKDSLRKYLSSLPTDTARSTALQTITRLLIYHTAHRLGCSHIVLGTCLTSLAVSLISSISQGGGFHVKEEIQEEWAPHSTQEVKSTRSHTNDIRIIRPLRDVGMKECAAWAWWNRVTVVGRESWEWTGSKPGIGKLTKDFIFGLEKDYPSTVSTIVRTCGKLAPKGEVSGQCLLCSRPIQQGVQEWKTRISIRSHNTDDSTPSDSVATALTPYLCYTCHTTLTSRSPRTAQDNPTNVPLPMWATSTHTTSFTSDALGVNKDDDIEVFVGKRTTEEQMHNIVKGFLLDE
ncbi:hypothetical protein QCA50_006203 [Cerrena zonata]|uniref:Cytoplasmic tRNA 2-thiolation protein 2 n=1 Tax=Cerrena zonata TaxID=2478898 RepID=A0AAW0GIR2_9APHY